MSEVLFWLCFPFIIFWLLVKSGQIDLALLRQLWRPAGWAHHWPRFPWRRWGFRLVAVLLVVVIGLVAGRQPELTFTLALKYALGVCGAAIIAMFGEVTT